MSINELNVGEEIPVKRNPVGKYQPVVYAGASGDFNPIHIDPEFGKMVGLGGNILHGLCTMGFVAKSMTDLAGDPGKLKKLKVRFAKPVKPLETVEVKGKVVSKEGGIVKIELGAWTNKGEVQVISNAEAELAE
jgi:3-hydroxybutyryl-CoA dehydratase